MGHRAKNQYAVLSQTKTLVDVNIIISKRKLESEEACIKDPTLHLGFFKYLFFFLNIALFLNLETSIQHFQPSFNGNNSDSSQSAKVFSISFPMFGTTVVREASRITVFRAGINNLTASEFALRIRQRT